MKWVRLIVATRVIINTGAAHPCTYSAFYTSMIFPWDTWGQKQKNSEIVLFF